MVSAVQYAVPSECGSFSATPITTSTPACFRRIAKRVRFRAAEFNGVFKIIGACFPGEILNAALDPERVTRQPAFAEGGEIRAVLAGLRNQRRRLFRSTPLCRKELARLVRRRGGMFLNLSCAIHKGERIIRENEFFPKARLTRFANSRRAIQSRKSSPPRISQVQHSFLAKTPSQLRQFGGLASR